MSNWLTEALEKAQRAFAEMPEWKQESLRYQTRQISRGGKRMLANHPQLISADDVPTSPPR